MDEAILDQGVGAPPSRGPDLPVIPVRNWGSRSASVVVVLIICAILYSLSKNPRVGWPVIGHYMLNPKILRGILVTLELTGLGMAVGIVLGVLLAVARVSQNVILRTGSYVYVWFFRGVPLLVQLIFWFNLAALFPRLDLGIPGLTFLGASTNTVISAYTAALLGLGLCEAAYMSEIVRAGILSIDPGHRLAAQALGLPPGRIMRRIILPQAMRVIIPPTGNELISMLRNTSLVSVIAVTELLTSVQNIYAVTYQTIPLLIVATIWYLILTSLCSAGLFYLERFFSKGSARTSGATRQGRYA